ncbi:MAG TPA: CDGSH iron-sulfur domain-containing protein [Acidimicrobiales bacterium]|jgi:CDGSH-type Zn-finger protein|nr:CDGSH iron-sulfur domain-containing protein [Acidimicrobiales bacterium]
MTEGSEGEATIAVTANGPYLVAGGVPLVRRRMVESELGEPLTWQTRGSLPVTDPMALCRCGQSGNKPFCDGSHRTNGFDGTETAPTSSYDERQTTYTGTRIVVRDDRSVCEHAGFCGNRMTDVWKMLRHGDTEDTVKRSQLIAMVERCPSGALTYRLEADGEDVEPELRAAIGVVEDGPLFVTGGVRIERADGEPMETRNRVTLCRCGGSGNKPLCDGSHQSNGFSDS